MYTIMTQQTLPIPGEAERLRANGTGGALNPQEIVRVNLFYCLNRPCGERRSALCARMTAPHIKPLLMTLVQCSALTPLTHGMIVLAR